ncbi:hypothetical protein ACF3OB_03280 [Capnocytophaga canis]|uniref:HYC_CC_PP family protein n=1 Tax=Capnocytophaga canis TaxID=1848903 RepID=UPI00370D915B
MIRRITSILLTIFILFSNSGWGFDLHFCQEQLTHISFKYIYATDNEDICSSLSKDCCIIYDDNLSSSEELHDECCDGDFFESSDYDNGKITTKSFEWHLYPCVLTQISVAQPPFIITKKTKKSIPSFYVDSNAPPLYELYCQLVFYA